MAEDKKVFLQGKMNQDLDSKLLPSGEYRAAQNIQITTSDGSDVGAIQNVLGNSLVPMSSIERIEIDSLNHGSNNNAEVIGFYPDETNNRIFYFVTNFPFETTIDVFDRFSNNTIAITKQSNAAPVKTQLVGKKSDTGNLIGLPTATSENFCAIYVVDIKLNENIAKKIVSGEFLNFNKNFLITGVNLVNDLLFFTDDYNQPRRINVQKAITDPSYYNTEDKISVAKYAPFFAPQLLDVQESLTNKPTASTKSGLQKNAEIIGDPKGEFLKEKFISFSYRFKYIDGEYSTIAPFTQACFIPETTELTIDDQRKILKKSKLHFQDTNGASKGMVNSINEVTMFIRMPSSEPIDDFGISEVEIIYKESTNNLFRSVETINLQNDSIENNYLKYIYKSTQPFKTLPKDEATRVFDNVPLRAKAQEIVGNRVVYGNIQLQRKLNKNAEGIVGLNFSASSSAKYDTETYLHNEYPFHSIKQRRKYEVGVVLSDRFGRQSPVLTSNVKAGTVFINAKDNTFNSSAWLDDATSLTSTSPGNLGYCGDALNITFNEEIKDAYANGTYVQLDGTAIFRGGDTISSANPKDENGKKIIKVGDFLKGEDKDFVKVVETSGKDIKCDGAINDSVLKTKDNIQYIFKYDLSLTHGWYSYRVVVKQVEQDYYNVYTPGVFNFQESKAFDATDDVGEEKSYFPIISDSINKVTRDKEFANEQEKGLSTSKVRLFPKVVSIGSEKQVLDNTDLIDVISVGTAKEHSLTNKSDHVYNFVFEPEKNHLLAQIPYASSSENFGVNVDNLASSLISLPDAERFNVSNNTMFQCESDGTPSTDGVVGLVTSSFAIGDFLKGENKDLVKIESVTENALQSNDKIKAKGDINYEVYEGKKPGDAVKLGYDIPKFSATTYTPPFYGTTASDAAKTGLLHVFETKPFESAIDIYYETSTSGYIHELNEDIVEPVTLGDLKVTVENETFEEKNSHQQGETSLFNTTNDKNGAVIAGLNIKSGNDNLTPDKFKKAKIVSVEPNVSSFIDLINANPFTLVESENKQSFDIKCNKNFTYENVNNNDGLKFTLQVELELNDFPGEIVNKTFDVNFENTAPIFDEVSVSDTKSNFKVGDEIDLSKSVVNGASDSSKNTNGLAFYFKDSSDNVTDSNDFFSISQQGILKIEKPFAFQAVKVFVVDNVIDVDGYQEYSQGLGIEYFVTTAINNGGIEVERIISIENIADSVIKIPKHYFYIYNHETTPFRDRSSEKTRQDYEDGVGGKVEHQGISVDYYDSDTKDISSGLAYNPRNLYFYDTSETKLSHWDNTVNGFSNLYKENNSKIVDHAKGYTFSAYTNGLSGCAYAIDLETSYISTDTDSDIPKIAVEHNNGYYFRGNKGNRFGSTLSSTSGTFHLLSHNTRDKVQSPGQDSMNHFTKINSQVISYTTGGRGSSLRTQYFLNSFLFYDVSSGYKSSVAKRVNSKITYGEAIGSQSFENSPNFTYIDFIGTFSDNSNTNKKGLNINSVSSDQREVFELPRSEASLGKYEKSETYRTGLYENEELGGFELKNPFQDGDGFSSRIPSFAYTEDSSMLEGRITGYLRAKRGAILAYKEDGQVDQVLLQTNPAGSGVDSNYNDNLSISDVDRTVRFLYETSIILYRGIEGGAVKWSVSYFGGDTDTKTFAYRLYYDWTADDAVENVAIDIKNVYLVRMDPALSKKHLITNKDHNLFLSYAQM